MVNASTVVAVVASVFNPNCTVVRGERSTRATLLRASGFFSQVSDRFGRTFEIPTKNIDTPASQADLKAMLQPNTVWASYRGGDGLALAALQAAYPAHEPVEPAATEVAAVAA